MIRVPDIENVARFCDGFFNGLSECCVSGGVVKHVQIRRRSEKGLVAEAWYVVVLVVFLDDDPFGVAG